ncbi:solute carrier family 13 member 2 isoform X1 [Phascolarctos cinereus]|uniref:Solute carrier family 13 member 2 isoform X1 n=1 Tax=Phascolarctos cinereus TaxID=38626 RepID=A0A6P5I9S5_PHACI|nr:solute carrier family 13 member 2 isoform X1 [Phascolarctos cinereus]
MVNLGQILWAYRRYLMAILFPVVLLPLPLVVSGKESKCAYVIILMALLWCTETLPLAVTAFFPLILFPMMAIMDASEVSIEYFRDTNVLFLGGLLMAVAVEHWNLHKRIALRVLLLIGVRPAFLFLGFMAVTAFLSMWISNTATTAMMVPIASAVLEQMHRTPEQKDGEAGSVNISFELQEPNYPVTEKEPQKLCEKDSSPVPPSVPPDHHRKEREHLKLSQGLSLSVCYAASIGGMATLTGTAPNLVLQGQVNSLFPDNPRVVNFASWFTFAFPTVIILLLLTWIWLQILFLGINFWKNFSWGEKAHKQEQAAYQVIKVEQKKLGPMSFAEKAIIFLFLLLVVLWFTREPGFFPGWGNVAFPNHSGESMVSDGTVAFFIGIILFIVPSELPSFSQQQGTQGKFKAPVALLNWNIVNKKMPWNVFFLLGGGFALAKGSEVSGLSPVAGKQADSSSKHPFSGHCPHPFSPCGCLHRMHQQCGHHHPLSAHPCFHGPGHLPQPTLCYAPLYHGILSSLHASCGHPA